MCDVLLPHCKESKFCVLVQLISSAHLLIKPTSVPTLQPHQTSHSAYTAGLGITLLHSVLLGYNVEKKILIWGHCPCGIPTFPPRLCVFSPGTSASTLTLKLCIVGDLACLHHPSLCEHGRGCEGALRWEGGSQIAPWASG